jgi:large subunit ribosomal protein L25
MELLLVAEEREALGKQKTVKFRKNGRIPGVLYGEGKPVEHITVNAHEFSHFVLKNGLGKLISLDIQKGKKTSKEHVLIKECQRHPLKGNILHVDFFRVAMDHLVTLKVPIHLTGEEKRPRDGAILELVIHELEISCLPGNIPDGITVDVSKLTVGTGLHAKDIVMPEGVRIATPAEEMIVLATSSTAGVDTTTTAAETSAEPEVIGAKKAEG